MKQRSYLMMKGVVVALGLLTAVICAGRAEIAQVLLSDVRTSKGPGVETTAGWHKYEHNPVLGGELGTCFDVFVLKEGDRYRMWFSWRPKKAIALVESTDGIHWSDPVIVLRAVEGSDWEPDINRPAVVKRADGYHMWYTGQVWDDVTTGRAWVGYAKSPDGVHWKRVSERPVLTGDQPWEDNAIICPHVMWDDSAKIFRMWYSAGGSYEAFAIGYATSPDGIHWTKATTNPIFTPNAHNYWERERVEGCQVLYTDGWYYMFYIGLPNIDHAQIGLVRSRDGITNWQRLPENPIIRTGTDAHAVDRNACYKPFAVWDGKQWLLWYNGRNVRFEQICLVFHEGKDFGFPQGN